MAHEPADRARIDFWLWCVRTHKTRQVAKQACLSGHISVAGKRAKPATAITVGMTITVTTPRGPVTLEVLAIPPTRVSAAHVGAFVLDHTPAQLPSPGRDKRVPGVSRERGLGRPTKKDRRAIEKWHREDN